MRKNGKIQSIKMQSFFCYFQMIALLILPGNQSGLMAILFGIVMSRVYVMQENFNKVLNVIKWIWEASFDGLSQATDEYISVKLLYQWIE